MSDSWDESDDDWDKSDDELDKRLGLVKVGDGDPAPTPPTTTPALFEDEDEDLTLKDKELDEKAALTLNRAKGSALASKRAAELAAREEFELARKAMEMEAEMEANMTPEERRRAAREREEDDARAMADDLFGGVDDSGSRGPSGGPGQAMMSGDKVVMKDLKDHLRHAKKVGECIQVSLAFHS
jgi:translation initiation factor 3 subunit J